MSKSSSRVEAADKSNGSGTCEFKGESAPECEPCVFSGYSGSLGRQSPILHFKMFKTDSCGALFEDEVGKMCTRLERELDLL